jgi:DNA-binding transcriptional regulator YiaG
VRRQLAIFLKELVQALSVNFATLNRWENRRSVPSKLAQRHFKQYCPQKKKKGELV